MIGNLLAAEAKLPLVAVAADFQKSPQIFMSHPGEGLDTWQELVKAKPVYVGAGAINTFYAWMKLVYGFKDEAIRPYNFNSGPLHHEQELDPAGLHHRRAVRDRAAGPFQAERIPALRLRLRHLFDPDRDPHRDHREEPRSRAALRRRLRDRLVSLSLRRQCRSERAHQAGQSRHQRRPDRLLDRGDEKTRRRRFGRCAETRHRRDDRRATGRTSSTRWSRSAWSARRTDYKRAYTLQFVNKGVGLDLRPK